MSSRDPEDPEDVKQAFKDLKRTTEEAPVRRKFEEVTTEIPTGPMGKVGGGNVIGAAGYLAASSLTPFWQFLPGIKQPGYRVTAHGTRRISNTENRHVLTVVAISGNVARFAAQYTAAPSNLDFLASEVQVVDVEKLSDKTVYNTWQVTVDIIETEIE